jgi:hypothetical protein
LKLSVLPLNYTLLTEDEDIYLFRGKQGGGWLPANPTGGKRSHYIYLNDKEI